MKQSLYNKLSSVAEDYQVSSEIHNLVHDLVQTPVAESMATVVYGLNPSTIIGHLVLHLQERPQ